MILKLVLFFLSFNVFAQSENDFIKLLQQNHPFFQIQKNNLDNLGVAKNIVNIYQDWNLTAEISHNNNGENTLNNGINKNYLNGSSVNINNAITKNTQYNNILTASYKIPLLQNYDGINSRLKLKLAEINQKIGTLQQKLDISQFINSNLKKLWQVVFLTKKIEIITKKLQIEKHQLGLIQDKFKHNLVDKSDVLLQENNYQNSQITLLNAKQEFTTITQELTNLLGQKFNYQKLNLTKIGEVPPINKNSSLVKILQLQILQKNLELKSLLNLTKPQIDLSLALSSAKTTENIFSGAPKNTTSIGLSVALPLFGSVDKAKIKQNKINLETIKHKITQQKLELKNQDILLLDKIKTIKKILKINKKQLKINRDKSLEFTKMYKNSNTEIRFVIDAQNQELNAKLNYFQNLLNYKNLILDYNNLWQ